MAVCTAASKSVTFSGFVNDMYDSTPTSTTAIADEGLYDEPPASGANEVTASGLPSKLPSHADYAGYEVTAGTTGNTAAAYETLPEHSNDEYLSINA